MVNYKAPKCYKWLLIITGEFNSSIATIIENLFFLNLFDFLVYGT